VWMRPAALPIFRKLYGWIGEDLQENDNITVNLLNNYNTYTFDGTKKVVLSTTSFLGGKNSFLGIAYLSVGGLCFFLAMVFLLMHINKPRYLILVCASLKFMPVPQCRAHIGQNGFGLALNTVCSLYRCY
jgi:hypothetical protein